MMLRRPWWTVPVAGGLPAIAAAAAAVLYDSPLLMLFVILAAALAGGLPNLMSRHRPGLAGPTAVLTLAAVLVVLLFTASGGVPPLDAARELTGALARLLSFAPPFPTRVDTLTPVVVAVWAASFLATALATRGWRLLAAAPPVVILLAALVLVGRSAPAPGWVAPAVGVGAALLTLGDSGQRRSGRTTSANASVPRLRPDRAAALFGCLAAVALTAVGLGTAQVVSDEGRVDARARYQPPQERPQPIDPLTRLAGWAKGDRQPLVSLQLDPPTSARASGPTPWRWAVLDEFDGARWTSSDRYRPTGERMRTAATSPGSEAPDLVQAGVRVSATLTPWLPTPGQVRRVTGVDVAINPDHDSVVQTGRADQDQSYGIVADRVALDPTQPKDRKRIATFRAGGSRIGEADVFAPGLPEQLRTIALGFAPAPGETDGQRALDLQDFLLAGQFVSDAPPGHLYLRLTQFFDDGDSRAFLRGTSEQFATAFAVLARSVGLPTRLVVGFQVPGGSGDDVTITGADMRAWPEVYFSGAGWVRFAPTPRDEGASSPRTPPKLKDLVPQTPQTVDSIPTDAGGSGRTTAPEKPADDPGHSGLAATVTAIAIALLLILFTVGVVVGLRIRLRAHRRRLHDPSQRAIGAWCELEDAIQLAGVGRPARTGGPATVVVDMVRGRIGAQIGSLADLARIANQAAFGPRGAIESRDADLAWSISDRATVELRRTSGNRRRLTWWIGPGPLRSRSRAGR